VRRIARALRTLEASARLSSRKSIGLYLGPRVAARRVRVQCDGMDNAVTYGFWAFGSVAILGAMLAFLVW
jgi:hypothetical protein